MAKKQEINQIEQILSAKKRKFPVLSIFSILSVLLVGSILYFDYFNLFGDEIEEIEYKNDYIVVEKGNMATTLTSSGTAKEGSLSNLYSNSSAEVTNVYFEVGDDVKKDDIIISFDDETATRNLEIAKSNLEQAKLTLEELENSPTDSDKLAANQSVKSAEQQVEISKQQLLNAEINLENLLTPLDSALNSANANLITSQSAVVNAKNAIDNSYVELLDSQKTYCETRLTDPQFEDQKAPVCSSNALPVSKENVSRLLDDIKSENEPTVTRVAATKALLLANSNYTNSLKTLENAESNLKTAEANLVALTSPSQNDVKQAETSVLVAESSLKASEISLETAIQSQKDILEGSSEYQILRQKESVYSAELNVQENQKIVDLLQIKSPRDGVIGQINVSVGDKVNAGTLVGIVSDITSISVDLSISESDLDGIKEGLLGLAIFDSIPDQPYIVRVTNLSIIPNINQGIVSYPVKADILTTREIAAALPELAKYASGISGASALSSFLPSGSMVQSPNSIPDINPSDVDISCLRDKIGEDFEITDFSPDTIEKIRRSGCLEKSLESRIASPDAIFNLIEQFSPSKLPVAGMGGNVILIKDLKENLILVPSKAIKRKGREAYVTKSIGDIEEDVVVNLGETDGERTSIISGLNEGDVVVLKYEVTDKDNIMDNFKEDEIKRQGPPTQPKSSGFRNNAGD
mgnify:CR=1 FL=1|tara:strand:+ start:1159 stop:3243 length:2085 start_codon:yes stop_codon:yes gene_type:complete